MCSDFLAQYPQYGLQALLQDFAGLAARYEQQEQKIH
jgi:hypothetical protein